MLKYLVSWLHKMSVWVQGPGGTEAAYFEDHRKIIILLFIMI